MIPIYWDNHSCEPLARRLTQVYTEWRGTPYMRDQLCKGVACDCVTFAYGFYCDLFKINYKGVHLPSLPKFSPKRSGNSKITFELIKIFKEKFSMVEWDKPIVNPGDLIAARTGKGFGHVFIVASEKNFLYHCNYDVGVVRSGFSAIASKPLILRSTERMSWV